MEKQEQETLAKKEELSKQLLELPEEADYSQNEEYVKLKAEHDKVLVELAKTDSLDHDELMFQFEEEKADLQAQLDNVNKIIAQAENNVRIDEQIADMQQKQREYGQAKADAEKILYQLKEVSKRKNELLVEEINQHFGIVRWKLFDFQKTENIRKFVFLRCLMKKPAFIRYSRTQQTLAGKLKRRLIFATVFRSSLICMFRFSLMVQKVSMTNMYRLLIRS